MKWLQSVFTGQQFWLLNGILNLVLTVTSVIVGVSAILPLIVMWISFATFEILNTIENKDKQNAV